MKTDILANGGRVINRAVSDTEIKMYLGLEECENEFDIMQEYIQFEEKYRNQNVDFCLNCDIETGFIKPNEIIENGKFLIIYK